MAGKFIDSDGLKNFYSENKVARMVLDYLASRKNDSRFTSVDRLLKVLDEHVDRREIIEVLKKFEQLGFGVFMVGRRSHPSRFRWFVSLTAVGQVAVGEAEEIEELPVQDLEKEDDGDEEEENGTDSSDHIEHTFVLRANLKVIFKLPKDFSNSESVRLSEFIKTLPFEPSQN